MRTAAVNRERWSVGTRNGVVPLAGLLLATPTLVAGCGDATSVATGWLQATIRGPEGSGSAETAYEGTGFFGVSPDPGSGVSVAFQLFSRGIDSSQGQSFSLLRSGSGRPGVGRYQLAPLKWNDGRQQGFTAYYGRHVADRAQYFTTLSGEVVVTTSSAHRVSGTFQFTGVQYCNAAPTDTPDNWCGDPNTIVPGAPQVQVSGSFTAIPAPTVDCPTRPGVSFDNGG